MISGFWSTRTRKSKKRPCELGFGAAGRRLTSASFQQERDEGRCTTTILSTIPERVTLHPGDLDGLAASRRRRSSEYACGNLGTLGSDGDVKMSPTRGRVISPGLDGGHRPSTATTRSTSGTAVSTRSVQFCTTRRERVRRPQAPRCPEYAESQTRYTGTGSPRRARFRYCALCRGPSGLDTATERPEQERAPTATAKIDAPTLRIGNFSGRRGKIQSTFEGSIARDDQERRPRPRPAWPHRPGQFPMAAEAAPQQRTNNSGRRLQVAEGPEGCGGGGKTPEPALIAQNGRRRARRVSNVKRQVARGSRQRTSRKRSRRLRVDPRQGDDDAGGADAAEGDEHEPGPDTPVKTGNGPAAAAIGTSTRQVSTRPRVKSERQIVPIPAGQSG